MTTTKTAKPTGLELLRVPFEKHQISKLPKPTSKDNAKGRCAECGGWHGLPAVHLDYVGHAALTDRLLECDPTWNWEPLSLEPDNSPKFDRNGGLWIKLTVCGVSRIGYGHPDGKTGGDAIKETIGDALRNAAMRFGAALDLWHKGDLHAEPEDDTKDEKKAEAKPNHPQPESLADFVMTCGSANVKGKKLKDIDTFDLNNCVTFFRKKHQTGAIEHSIQQAEKWLKQFEVKKPMNGKDPQFDANEQVPF